MTSLDGTATTDVSEREDRPASMAVLRTSRRMRALWPLAAMAPSFMAMYGMFLWDRVYCYRDGATVFFPIQVWFSRSIASGQLPFWDPYLGFGQSAVADPLRQMLFPPVLLLRLVPWPALAHNLVLGLPMPVAALGLYVLLRRWLSRSAAALGGAVFSTSATVLSTASMPNMSWSVALAPWTIAAFCALARSGAGWRVSVAAACVGLQALAGEPLTLAMTLAIACAWAVALDAPRDRTLVARGILLVAAAGLGSALAAILYLPLYDMARLSLRAPGGAVADYFSLHPLRLLESVVPFPFESPVMIPTAFSAWQGKLSNARAPLLMSNYLGIPVLTLASVGLVSTNRRRAVCVALVGLVCLVLAFGLHTPVFAFVHSTIPGLSSLRFPEKYAVGAVLAVAILAAEGWQILESGAGTRRSGWAAVVTVVVTCGLVLAAYVFADSAAALVGAGSSAALELRSALRHSTVTTACVALATGTIVFALIARRHVRLMLVALAAIIFPSLVLHGVGVNPQIDVSLMAEPAWVARAKQIGGRAYVGLRLVEAFPDYFAGSQRDSSFPDVFVPHIRGPAGSPAYVGEVAHQVKTGRYPSQWGLGEVVSVDVAGAWSRSYHLFLSKLLLSSREARAVALERTGVRTQLRADQPLGAYDAVEEVEGIEPTVVAYSHEPFEMAFVATESQVEPDEAAAIKRGLFEAGFDMKREALLERESGGWGRAGAPEAAGARIVKQRDDAMEVEATAPGEATLVIVENYDPGWRARVDGEAAEVVRVDGILRGVRLRPGRHRVELWYVPRGLAIGAAITATTALLLAIIAAWSLARTRRLRVAALPADS